MTDYSGALWIPNNNSFFEQNHPRYIVLHGTAGGNNAAAIAEYFQSTQGTSNPVSAHYVVDQAGVIVQCNSEQDGAWANGFISGPSGTSGDGIGNGFHDQWWDAHANPNTYTISIEHVKSATDNSNQLTPAQQQASFKLIADICRRHNIPMRKADALGGITGHYAIDPINRALCPGPYPWDELWAFLEGANVLDISHVSQYFTEVMPDQRWHCKSTGFDVALGILAYYRTCTQVGLNGLSQYGLPVSSEEKAPNTKQAVLQRFERGVIIYDVAHEVDSVPGLTGPCYPAHIDKGPGQDPRITQLQSQIAALPQVAPSSVASAVNTLQTLQVTLQASANATGKIITDLKG